MYLKMRENKELFHIERKVENVSSLREKKTKFCVYLKPNRTETLFGGCRNL